MTGTPYDRVRGSGEWFGDATITATWQGAVATAKIEVYNKGAVELTAPDTLRALGDTARLGVGTYDPYDRPMPPGYLDWASRDESVAVVDNTGLVTAVGNGSAKVVAGLGGADVDSVVVAVAQLATGVGVETVADTLRAVGDTLRLNAEARDANGHAVPASLLSWWSADDSVVAVSGEGLVTAVGNGTAEVFAASRRDTASAVVTVEQRAAGVRVVPSADTLRALRDTLRLAAELVDTNRNALPARRPESFAWRSSDESVATVDPAGRVTALAVGTVEITAGLVEAGLVGITSLRVRFIGEREVLAAFYRSTGGPRWRNSRNWLTDAPLEAWHGVETDSAGRVVGNLSGIQSATVGGPWTSFE